MYKPTKYNIDAKEEIPLYNYCGPRLKPQDEFYYLALVPVLN